MVLVSAPSSSGTRGNGALRIEIKGELGGILTLCETSETRKPGREGRALAEQIKMVAGARNQRDPGMIRVDV